MWIQGSLLCEVCGQEFHRYESAMWTCDGSGGGNPLVCSCCEALAVTYVIMSLKWLLVMPQAKRVGRVEESFPSLSSRVSSLPEWKMSP